MSFFRDFNVTKPQRRSAHTNTLTFSHTHDWPSGSRVFFGFLQLGFFGPKVVSKTFFDCQGVTQHPKKIFSSEFENCFYFVMFVVMQALCCECRGFWLG